MKIRLLTFLSTFIFTGFLVAGVDVDIFPTPKDVGMKKGLSYEVQKQTPVYFDKGVSKAFADICIAQLGKVSDSEFKKTDDKNAAHVLTFELKKEMKFPKEKYILDVSKTGIAVRASHEAGLFYGMQSLSQLFSGEESIGLYVIIDQPRYAYRGLHLDVSRHFFDVDFIKRYIDLMALYKYNVFHWHLSDDDGWRIESKLYPKLTEVGAYRDRVGRPGNQGAGLNVDDGKPYGGFYTQEQIKEVIAYAKARNVEVIPEIDVPGHSAAIIKAYPELGASHDVLNIGNPKTIEFLEKLFTEVAELFPSKYVHIGCDEVGLGAWKNNKDCLAKMKELGTEDPHDLHRWLVHHLHDHLAKQNKQSVAWCEVLDAKVKKDVLVMCWRDNNGWVKAPKLGHQIIVTPSMQAYFNYREDVGTLAPGHGGYRTVIEKVYNFDPTDDSLTDEQKKLVLGGQGCVWTEYIPLPKHVEYITFPRAIALSEALWSPKEKKDYSTLHKRLVFQYEYMDKFGVRYAVLAPEAKSLKVKFAGETKITLTNPNQHGTIHYTLDGSEPDANSPTYPEGGITVTESGKVKASVVFSKARKSYSVSIGCEKEAPIPAVKLNGAKQGVWQTQYLYTKDGSWLHSKPVSRVKIDSTAPYKGAARKDATILENVGFIKIEKMGAYIFNVRNGQGVFYLHSKALKKGQAVSLAAGLHPFVLTQESKNGVSPARVEMQTADGAVLKDMDKLLYRSSRMKRNDYVITDSNISFQGKHPLANALDDSEDTFAWTNGVVKPGDVIIYRFSNPRELKSIKIITGKKNGGDKLQGADLEVSTDGKTFKKLADFTGGIASGTPEGKIAAVRIKVIRPQNEWLVIRSAEFVEKK